MEKSIRIEDYIKMHIKNVETMIKESGSLEAFITVMGEIQEGEDKGKGAIIMIDVPSPDEISKQEFVNEVIPEIGKQIRNDKHIDIKCVTFNAESWLRKADAEDKKTQEKILTGNWKDLPREEVLFMDISTEDGSSCRVYDIYRDRFSVDESGELIKDGLLEENVELVLNEDMSFDQSKGNMGGLFSNLYEKFTKL